MQEKNFGAGLTAGDLYKTSAGVVMIVNLININKPASGFLPAGFFYFLLPKIFINQYLHHVK